MGNYASLGTKDMNVCRYTVLLGLTSLVIIPYTATGVAQTLREEAVTYRAHGYEAQQRGDLVEALTAYQKAAALDPAYPTPHNDMGVVLEQEGRLKEAEVAYQRALRLDPNYPEPHANLAMLYERMGRPEKAAHSWKQRYEKGDADESGTRRAKARLLQLGILDAPQSSMELGANPHDGLVEQEFQAHTKSLERFYAVTDAHSSDWP